MARDQKLNLVYSVVVFLLGVLVGCAMLASMARRADNRVAESLNLVERVQAMNEELVVTAEKYGIEARRAKGLAKGFEDLYRQCRER